MTRTLSRLILLLLLAPHALADARPIGERWYIVELAGARAGHMHERTETLASGDVRVTSTMDLAIARGPATVSVTVKAESLERADGEPISMRVEQRLGAAALSTEVTFEGRKATIVESQFGQKGAPRTIEISRDALMPGAMSRELERRIAAGENIITISGVDPMSASVVESTYTRGEREIIDAAGRAAPATRWTVEQSAMPGIRTTYFLDDEGEMIRGEIALGGISLSMLLAEKELALADVEPAELLVSTLVTPDRPIENPRAARSASYILRTVDSAMPDLPAWGTQTTQRINEGAVRVLVSTSLAGDRATQTERQEALRPSVMIDSDDDEISALAERATRDIRGALLDDLREVARSCGRFVHSFIDEKSLDVGFATASEVARTRQGDCTEHAVLLAAILRARGIPSRVVSGLIYVDEFVGEKGVFGFHMWTQALLPDDNGVERWVDLDATLPDAGFDAAHIGVAVSTLGGSDRVNTMAAVAPLIGSVSIEVERVRSEQPADTIAR
jgi:transglutaminase-like putative cysteine protease